MKPHHEVFSKFDCWQGEVQAGISVNFLGVMTRECFFNKMIQHVNSRYVATDYPEITEQYYEWIALLESVTNAKGQFTMIELGAGWGPWSVNAALAVSQHSNLPYNLIAVEAEPTHFQWMNAHFRDNNVDPNDHRLIQGVAADRDGAIWFLQGKSADTYGQRLIPAWALLPIRTRELIRRLRGKNAFKARRVKTISLKTLLHAKNKVDLIDLDVQGAEFRVLNAAREQIDRKTKKVHIGTHNKRVEGSLHKLFTELGWINTADYPANCRCQTEWGAITFEDGVQTWVNPKLSE